MYNISSFSIEDDCFLMKHGHLNCEPMSVSCTTLLVESIFRVCVGVSLYLFLAVLLPSTLFYIWRQNTAALVCIVQIRSIARYIAYELITWKWHIFIKWLLSYLSGISWPWIDYLMISKATWTTAMCSWFLLLDPTSLWIPWYALLAYQFYLHSFSSYGSRVLISNYGSLQAKFLFYAIEI